MKKDDKLYVDDKKKKKKDGKIEISISLLSIEGIFGILLPYVKKFIEMILGIKIKIISPVLLCIGLLTPMLISIFISVYAIYLDKEMLRRKAEVILLADLVLYMVVLFIARFVFGVI